MTLAAPGAYVTSDNTSELVAIQSDSTLYTASGPGDDWENLGSATNGYWKTSGGRAAKYDGNVGLKITDNPTAGTPTWTTVWGTNIAASGTAWSVG